MRPAPLVAVVALAGAVTAAQLTGSTASPPRPAPVVTTPVTNTTLVCPHLAGAAGSVTQTAAVVADVGRALSPPSTSTGTVTTTTLRGPHSHHTPVRLAPSIRVDGDTATDGAVAVAATGSVAATMIADQVTEVSRGRLRSLISTRCNPPSADWWFAGADGRVGYSDRLFVANPTGTAADVSVSVWSPKGQLTPPRLAALPIPPRSSVVVSIPSVAPDDPTLALHVHATSGAVTADLLDQRVSGVDPAGSDWIPATQPPTKSLVVPGFPTGAGNRSLVLANPGSLDATVAIRIISTSGSFAPSGIHQQVVPAGKTRLVDLSRALAGATGAVSVQSDRPVVAQGLAITTATGGLPDLQWLAAVPPLSGPAGYADGREPDGGTTQLLLTAPAGAVTVRISRLGGVSRTVTVPAGHSIATDTTTMNGTNAATSGLVVTPMGSAPVYATRMMLFAGAHGALTTSEPVLSLPSAVRLPIVNEDQRTGLRSTG
jgi:hypothetical protein